MKVNQKKALTIFDLLVKYTAAPENERTNFVDSITSGAGRYEYKSGWNIPRDVMWTFINGNGLWAVEVDFEELDINQAMSVITCNEDLGHLLRLHASDLFDREHEIRLAARRRRKDK